MAPAIRVIDFVLSHQGFSLTKVGTGLTLQGFLIILFLTPKKDPIKTKGEEQHNHKSSKTKISLNFN